MADEKLNPGQGEQIKLDISGAPPAPDLTGEGPPAPEPGSPAELGPGDVVVDVGKIDELKRPYAGLNPKVKQSGETKLGGTQAVRDTAENGG